LTEDRTLKHSSVAFGKISHQVAVTKDAPTIRRILTAPKGTNEHHLNFDDLRFYEWMMSDEFKLVLTEEFNANNEALNMSAKGVHKSLQQKHITKNLEEDKLSAVEKKMLDRAVSVAERICPGIRDYPLVIVKNLGQSTMAMADMELRRIIVAKPVFMIGTKYIVSTLIEEYIHLRYGHRDCTRELQTHLFDQITSMLEEHILGEPI
jgi:hypothetical protein